MARIHFKDGHFLGLGTWEEKALWKHAGFRYSPLRKAWCTDRLDIAEAVKGVAWTPEARLEVADLLNVAETSRTLSYADTSDYEPPVPSGIHPLTGEPFAFFPYQKAGIQYCLQRKDTLIGDQPGLGKQMSVETPIYTPTGWRRMGDLAVGDLVYSIDGQPTKVTGVYPQGVKPNYELTFRDGTVTNCGLDHLWAVGSPENRWRNSKRGTPEYSVRSLRHLLESGLTKKRPGNRIGARWYIPLSAAVEHPPVNLPIDPYVLGVLIGDGCILPRHLRFSNSDKGSAIREEVRSRLPSDITMHENRSGQCPYFDLRGPGKKRWKTVIEAWGLDVYSESKFIPDAYKHASVEQRLSLLRGLMDTDGSCTKNRTTFHTTALQLANDVAELVRSLGGMAVERWYARLSEGDKPPEAQINVKLPVCPFLLPYKIAEWRPFVERRRYIKSAEYVGEVEQVCITVEHPSHLYIVEHFIVTHNTTMGVGVLNGDPNAKRVLVICPASLKEHWRREFNLWKTKPVSVGIAETKYREKFQDGVFKNGKPRFKIVVHDRVWPHGCDVVIINYDILDRFDDEINAGVWDLLIVDEAHALMTEDSGRTLFVLGGRKREKIDGRWKQLWFNAVEANRRVFLTGTPMMNRPIDMWPMIHAFDPDGLGRDKKDFGYRYCDGFFDLTRGPKGDYNFTGSSNLVELGAGLRASFMVRRLKKDVLPDLPPKFRQMVVLDSPEIKALVAREDELAQELRLYEAMLQPNETEPQRDARIAAEIADAASRMGFEDADDPDKPTARNLNLDYAQSVLGLEPSAVKVLFTEMATVRRELGMAKLPAVVAWVKTYLDGGEADEKLIVFAYHTDVVKGLAAALAKYNPVAIWGGVPPNKRQGLVDTFQDDPRCRVAILQIDSGGQGYTLTRAKDVAFAEGDWRPTKMEQAFDRICRIGQKALKLLGFFLVANGSLDQRMALVAYGKEETINEALDT